LGDLPRRERSRLKRFSFTAVRPSFDTHPFQVCGRDEGNSTSVPWGRITMVA
jgi:3-methylfumaryl-CoA hydratase